MNYIIVSYYTNDYKNHAIELQKSLDFLNLNYSIRNIPDRGSWLLNDRQRPMFLLSIMHEYIKSVVWLDADSYVLEEPILFNNIITDIALSYYDNTPLIGTMFLNNNENTQKLLVDWYLGCCESKIDSQIIFRDILRKSKITITKLPYSYCYLMNEKKICEHPIIIQDYVSRNGDKK